MTSTMPPVLLTIAASDPLGGAGVQADLSAFAALGVHGACALTAVTAQSLKAVTALQAVDVDLVAEQIDSVISSLGVSGVKTGLLRRREVVELVAERIKSGDLPPPVIDPVMVDGRGSAFVDQQTRDAYRKQLFPLARAITPNRREAELLAGQPLPGPEAVVGCAEVFRELGAEAVVVTGGAFDDKPDDVVIPADGDAWVIENQRIQTRNVRGSGCTFSAALAVEFALGRGLEDAVNAAAAFARCAIQDAADWQFDGPGPVSHLQSTQKPL